MSGFNEPCDLVRRARLAGDEIVITVPVLIEGGRPIAACQIADELAEYVRSTRATRSWVTRTARTAWLTR